MIGFRGYQQRHLPPCTTKLPVCRRGDDDDDGIELKMIGFAALPKFNLALVILRDRCCYYFPGYWFSIAGGLLVIDHHQKTQLHSQFHPNSNLHTSSITPTPVATPGDATDAAVL